MTHLRLVAVATMIVLLSGVTLAQGPVDPGPEGVLPIGRWAQKRGQLSTRNQAVTFIDPCVGNGFLPSVVPVDSDGRFDVEGTFRFSTPVPEAPYFPVRYVGQLRGTHMALAVISLDPEHPFVRAYQLRKGRKASFRGCPD